METEYFRDLDPLDPEEDYDNRFWHHGRDIVDEFLARDPSKPWRVTWERIGAARLAKIWLDYGKSGVLRDTKGMGKIASQMLDLIPRLDMCNALSGHDSFDPLEELAFSDRKIHADDKDRFLEGLCLPDGSWLVSDYGIPHLRKIHKQILLAEPGKEELHAVDRALNVIHQRGDIASFFIEGGSATLTKIANQGGYQCPEISDENLGGHKLNLALTIAA